MMEYSQIVAKPENFYYQVTEDILGYLTQSTLQEKKSENINKIIDELAQKFCENMNEHTGDIIVLKSQRYVKFLEETFIPINYQEIYPKSQLFFKILVRSGFLTPQEAAKLFETTLELRNQNEKSILKEKERTIDAKQNHQSWNVLDGIFERIIESEKEQVQKNKQELEEAWKEFAMFFSFIDFAGLGVPDARLMKYGSSQTDFQTSSSDVDVTLLTKNYIDERALLKAIKEYFDWFNQDGTFGGEMELQAKTDIRIPYLKFKFKDFYFDLTINNLFGIINTKLLNTYASVDLRCPKLLMLVKLWAKANGICSGYEYLSSYAYTLMMINFLQILKHPILPSLQVLAKEPKEIMIKRVLDNQNEDIQKVNFAFETDMGPIKSSISRQNRKYSLSMLFISFIEWYINFQEHNCTISVKNGCLLPRKEILELNANDTQKNPKNFVFSIEDPFDQTHDVGKNFRFNSKITTNDNQKVEKYEKFKNIMKSTEKILNDFYEGKIDEAVILKLFQQKSN